MAMQKTQHVTIAKKDFKIRVVHEGKITTMSNNDFWNIVKMCEVKYELHEAYPGWRILEVITPNQIEPILIDLISQVH